MMGTLRLMPALGPASATASSRNTSSSAASPCAWTHASRCRRGVVIPASIGSTRCPGAGPAPFFACVRWAPAVLFVLGGSLVPASGDRLSWPTRFSRRPGSRRYSVLKFNTGRDIPLMDKAPSRDVEVYYDTERLLRL